MFRQITFSIICLTVIFSAGCRNLYLKDDRKTDTMIGFHSEQMSKEAIKLIEPPPPSELPEATEARREEIAKQIISRAEIIFETVEARRTRHGSAHVDFPDDFQGQMKQSYKVLGGYESNTRFWTAWERRAIRAVGGFVGWLTGNPGIASGISALLISLMGSGCLWLKARSGRKKAERDAAERAEAAKRAEEDALHVVDNLRGASRRGEVLEDEKGDGTPALAKATARLRAAFDRRKNGGT